MPTTLKFCIFLLVVGADTQLVSWVGGLQSKPIWLLRYNASLGPINSTCNSKFCGDQTVQVKDTLKGSRDNGRKSTDFWYENFPIPPIAIADSRTIPEGSCKRQLARYIDDLRNGTMWATQMYDASTKYPDGIIDGHTRHLGSFDQCYRIDVRLSPGIEEHVQGRYCLVNFEYDLRRKNTGTRGQFDFDFDPNDSVWEAIKEKGDYRRIRRYQLQMALCVPATCSADDVEKALQAPYNDFATDHDMVVKVSVPRDNCQAYHEEPAFSTGAIFFLVGLFIIFALVVISSLYDGTLSTEEEKKVNSITQQLLLCFSLRRNIHTIMEVQYKHRGMDSIHLIRFFSMCGVIIGHRMMQFYFNPTVNLRYLEMSFAIPPAVIIHNGTIIVDGFFGIGGLLTCYGLLDLFDNSKRINFLNLILIRFIRLTPSYVFLILFYAYLFPHLGSGPLWRFKIGVEGDNCAATWWANIFYLNNYLTMEKLCVFQSWYIAVDFHCYLISIFLIYAFWKLPRRIGYSLFGVAVFISIVISFYDTYVNQTQPLFIGFPYLKDVKEDPYFISNYVKSHLRLSSYFVGVVYGAILYDYRKASWRISKRLSQAMFILFVVMMSIYSQSFGMPLYNPNFKASALHKAFYASLHRGAFAASFCSIVLLLTIGDGLDFHYNVFTPRWVQPLSRLTYSTYLSHNIFQIYHIGTARSARTISIHDMIWNLIPDLFYSLLISSIITLSIEMPFRKMEKCLFWKKVNQVNKSFSENKLSELKVNEKKID